MASTKEKEMSILSQWYKDAGFEIGGEAHNAINRGLQSYRNDALDIPFTRQVGKIMVATITLFTERNAMIERWPREVRRMLSRTTPQDGSAQDAPPEPFTTWARPRDLEKRKQAVAVWYNLIAFLVYHWENYDERKLIEKMGLKIRDDRLRELIDDISVYSKIRYKTVAMTEAIESFCRLALTDEHATPTSNPFLWWIAVLVQSEALDSQPRLPIHNMVDQLNFEGKLSALDHYTRVLMLHYALEKSPGYPSKYVISSLDQIVIDWVDFDQERPPTDSDRENSILAHHDWIGLLAEIEEIVNSWCAGGSPGPMHTILCLKKSLKTGESMPALRYEELGLGDTAEPVAGNDQTPTGYKVMLHITESFTTDPRVNRGTYPAMVDRMRTLDEANGKLVRALKMELGGKRDALHWDEIIRSDGTKKIRAVYLHPMENAKGMAWVEKCYEDMWFSSDREPDSDDDLDDGSDEARSEAFARVLLHLGNSRNTL